MTRSTSVIIEMTDTSGVVLVYDNWVKSGEKLSVGVFPDHFQFSGIHDDFSDGFFKVLAVYLLYLFFWES